MPTKKAPAKKAPAKKAPAKKAPAKKAPASVPGVPLRRAWRVSDAAGRTTMAAAPDAAAALSVADGVLAGRAEVAEDVTDSLDGCHGTLAATLAEGAATAPEAFLLQLVCGSVSAPGPSRRWRRAGAGPIAEPVPTETDGPAEAAALDWQGQGEDLAAAG